MKQVPGYKRNHMTEHYTLSNALGNSALEGFFFNKTFQKPKKT